MEVSIDLLCRARSRFARCISLQYAFNFRCIGRISDVFASQWTISTQNTRRGTNPKDLAKCLEIVNLGRRVRRSYRLRFSSYNRLRNNFSGRRRSGIQRLGNDLVNKLRRSRRSRCSRFNRSRSNRGRRGGTTKQISLPSLLGCLLLCSGLLLQFFDRLRVKPKQRGLLSSQKLLELGLRRFNFRSLALRLLPCLIGSGLLIPGGLFCYRRGQLAFGGKQFSLPALKLFTRRCLCSCRRHQGRSSTQLKAGQLHLRVLGQNLINTGGRVAYFSCQLPRTPTFKRLGIGFFTLRTGTCCACPTTKPTKSTASHCATHGALHDAVPLFAAKDLWVVGNKFFSRDVDGFLCALGQTFCRYACSYTCGDTAQQSSVHAGFFQHFLNEADLGGASNLACQRSREDGIKRRRSSAKKGSGPRL